MRQTIPWMAWIGAVVVWWIAWVWGVFGTIQAGNTKLQIECDQLKEQKAQTLNMLATAPELRARIDSVSTNYLFAIANFASTDNLQRLPDQLTDSGLEHGIPQVEVSLNLASVLALTPSSAARTLDTLVVQLSAQGEFRDIGNWLDNVEKRADFLQWNTCRWESAPQEGSTDFSGTAQFRIVTNCVDKSAANGSEIDE